eukprot:TRINITY_DN3645_c0_g1_i1.p1 TRINITY_DN3645_c0_g1~~TRINITY_DN3645_c0_g1_i1.p1  ORF type:complete len:1451 (+),score=282.55 TRINITY_DN3645_c0_g1_i1:67-4419(+)
MIMNRISLCVLLVLQGILAGGQYTLTKEDVVCSESRCLLNLSQVGHSHVVVTDEVIIPMKEYAVWAESPVKILELHTSIARASLLTVKNVTVIGRNGATIHSGGHVQLSGTLHFEDTLITSDTSLNISCGTSITGTSSHIFSSGSTHFGDQGCPNSIISTNIPIVFSKQSSISIHSDTSVSSFSAEAASLLLASDASLTLHDGSLISSWVCMSPSSALHFDTTSASPFRLNESTFTIDSNTSYSDSSSYPKVEISSLMKIRESAFSPCIAVSVNNSAEVLLIGPTTLHGSLELVSGTLAGMGSLDLSSLSWDVSFRIAEDVTIVLRDEGIVHGEGQQKINETRGTMKVMQNASLSLNSGQVCMLVPVHFVVNGQVRVTGCVTLLDSDWLLQDRIGAEPLLKARSITDGRVMLHGKHVFDCNRSEATPAPTAMLSGDQEMDRSEWQPCLVASYIHAITLLPAAQMTLRDAVTVDAQELHLSNGSTLLVLGNNVKTTASITSHEEATIKVLGTNAVFRVVGDIHSRGNLTLGISSATACENSPLQLEGNLKIEPSSVLRCAETLWPQNGEYKPIARWTGVVTLPNEGVTLRDCTDDKRVTYTLHKHSDMLLLQFFVERGWENEKQVYAGYTVCMAAVFVLMTPLFMNLGWRGILQQITRRPPVAVVLKWHEFRIFLPNFVVAFFMAFEVLWLCGVMFHPSVPLPNQLSRLQGWFHRWVYLRASTMKGFETGFGLCASFVLIWCLAWVPLLVSKRSTGVLAECIDFRRYLSRFLVFHRNITALGNFVLLPALTILLQPFNCLCGDKERGVVLSVNMSVSCWETTYHFGLILISSVASIMLCALCVWSASNQTIPFGHPPYRIDLDLRNKGVFEAMRVSLLMMQVVTMSVFDQDVVSLLVVSFIIQALYLVLTLTSAPCGHYNINSFRVHGLCLSVWGIFVSGCCTWFYGPFPLPSCGTIGAAFAFLYLCGVLLLCFKHYYESTLTIHNEQTELSNAVLARQEVVKNIREKIVLLRGESYKDSTLIPETPTGEDGSGLGSSTGQLTTRVEIARLQLQYMKELEGYRAFKEKFLMPYYLGREAEEVNSVEMLELEFDPGLEYEGWVKGQLLGRGSFGSVYLGVLRGGGLIAVKVIDLRQGDAKRPEEMQKIKKEVDFIRSLKHPNIVEYKACTFDEENNAIHIFMEYAVGGSLTSLVRRCTERLGEEVIRLYMLHILRGLVYLHSKGVVHRDIKGENILLDAAGTAKLADFGCAVQTQAQQTACGTLIGSPYWMAPEVIKNKGYGSKADIWSVGCTAVEALNGGSPPWKEFDTVFAAMYYISNATEEPNNMPPGLSPLCISFLGICFERDTTKRANAEELLNHPWVADFQEYEPRTRDFVSRKCAEDKAKLDDYQTLVDTVVTDGPDYTGESSFRHRSNSSMSGPSSVPPTNSSPLMSGGYCRLSTAEEGHFEEA